MDHQRLGGTRKRYQTQVSIPFEVHDQNEQMRLHHRAAIQAIWSWQMQIRLNTHSQPVAVRDIQKPIAIWLRQPPIECLHLHFPDDFFTWMLSNEIQSISSFELDWSATIETAFPDLCHCTTIFGSSRIPLGETKLLEDH
jgi:hypothetical protein